MATQPLEIARCIGDMVAKGRITEAQGRETLTRLEADVKANAAAGISEAQAVLKSATAMAEEAKAWTKLVALRAARFSELMTRVEAHPRGYFHGALGRIVRDLSMRDADNAYARGDAVAHQAFALMTEFVEKYRSKKLGLVRDIESLDRVVDEIYGVASGDGAAKAGADGFKRANEFLRDRFNAAGGDIKPREIYMPQRWDAAKLRAFVSAKGEAAFVDWMLGERAAGRLRIQDWKTGKSVDDARALQIVQNALPRIMSEGLSDLVPGAALREPIAFRHAAHLVFEWTSAPAWKAWNEQFGVGKAGLFDAFIGHVQQMGREIGLMETLTPDPGWAVRALIDQGLRDGKLTDREATRIQRAWEIASHTAQVPENEVVANVANSIRAWQSSAKLLSAPLSAVSDLGYTALTARMNDLPAARVLGEYLRLLAGLGREERLRLAARSGITAETALRRAHAGLRESMDETFKGWAGGLADTLIRASGLNAHTDLLRTAFGLELMAHLADLAPKRLDALPEAIQGQFARYGIDARMWDDLRRNAIDKAGPFPVLAPAEMIRKSAADERAGIEAATRLLEYIRTETDFAVPTPGGAERALIHWLAGGGRPGAFGRETLYMGAQFKSFAISVFTHHGYRMVHELREGDRGAYIVQMAALTALLGAAAMQLKAVANGRDPRDMRDGKFWAAAWFQSGGLGIITDWIYQTGTKQPAEAMMSMALGPFGQTLGQLGQLAFGSVVQTSEGKNTRAGAELVRIFKQNTPGSSLWYTRLGTDRLLWDQLQSQIDPDYLRAFHRTEQRARREHNQSFWWRPGQATPARAPDLGAAAAP